MLLARRNMMAKTKKPAYWGLCFTAKEPNVVVNMSKTTTPPAVTLEYSTDGTEWTAFDADGGTTPVTLTKIGDKVYFKAGSGGNAAFANSSSAYHTFTLSGFAAASGNLMSIFDAEDEDNIAFTSDYAALNLFYKASKLTTAPELPATMLADHCYQYMFYGCTALTTAPAVLPATGLVDYCYDHMFSGCTSLTTAPEIPATGIADGCYTHMFDGCTSLTTAPAVLPATTLAASCYMGMFRGCTSLTTAPALPATTLAASCYTGMFYGCTALTTAPELPATMLADHCYQYMFYGCTALTTAPEIPATMLADYCYHYMFGGCTALTTAPAVLPVTTLADSCYTGMFSGCTSLTTAPALPATTLASNCYSSMFYGCTALTTAPELPATGIAASCYTHMFDGCTSLTTAPEIPATMLADYCYQYMFYGCTALTTAPELPATGIAASCYTHMFDGCTSLTTAPELPATMLADYCYQYMFYGCTALTTAPELPATMLADYCYQYMFYGCTALTTAPELPATMLADYCYQYMFYGCTALTTAPAVLPATGLVDYCYDHMFSGCTSLTTAPDIKAYSYPSRACTYMFQGCVNLTSIKVWFMSPTTRNGLFCWLYGVAPAGVLMCPAEYGTDATITRGSAGCPEGWTVVNFEVDNAPILTFTAEQANSTVELSKNGSPTKTPVLRYRTHDGSTWGAWTTFTPGTTSVTLPSVGDKMQLLSDGALVVSASSIGNYWKFNLTGRIAASGWIHLAFGTGTFACFKLFSGNTALVSAPDIGLGITSTDSASYREMFSGCTSLVTPPSELPAMKLGSTPSNWGGRMFYNCSSLVRAPVIYLVAMPSSVSTVLSGAFQRCQNLREIELRRMTSWGSGLTNWVSGVSATGTFKCLAALGTNETIERGTNRCPAGWTVVNI